MSKNIYIGLDVGGTKIEGAVAALNEDTRSFEVLSKIRIPLPSHQFDHFIDSLAKFINQLIEQAGVERASINGLGMGLPGSIDPRTQFMINGNTHFLVGQSIAENLGEKLRWDIPITIENDANLFTLAECWGGAGKIFEKEHACAFAQQVALGITLGTGVGGGLVSKGSIFQGAHGGSMEVGHISLDAQGRKCYCHQFGCAEAYLSGTALENNRFNWTSKEVFLQYREENINAEKILRDYREKLLHLLRTLSNLFNPHYIVFGGGLSNQPDLFTNLKNELDQCLFLGKNYGPEIYMNQLGDSAGLFGAMINVHEKRSKS